MSIAQGVGNFAGEVGAGAARAGGRFFESFLVGIGFDQDDLSAYYNTFGEIFREFFSSFFQLLSTGEWSFELGDISERIEENQTEFWQGILDAANEHGLDIGTEDIIRGMEEAEAAGVEIPMKNGLIQALQSNEVTPAHRARLEQLAEYGRTEENEFEDGAEFISGREAVDGALIRSLRETYDMQGVDAEYLADVREGYDQLDAAGFIEKNEDGSTPDLLDDIARKIEEGVASARDIEFIDRLAQEGRSTGITHFRQERFYEVWQLNDQERFTNAGARITTGDEAIVNARVGDYGADMESFVEEEYGITLDMQAVAETIRDFERRDLETGLSIEEYHQRMQNGTITEEDIHFLKALEAGQDAFYEESFNLKEAFLVTSPIAYALGYRHDMLLNGRDVSVRGNFSFEGERELASAFRDARTPGMNSAFTASSADPDVSGPSAGPGQDRDDDAQMQGPGVTAGT